MCRFRITANRMHEQFIKTPMKPYCRDCMRARDFSYLGRIESQVQVRGTYSTAIGSRRCRRSRSGSGISRNRRQTQQTGHQDARCHTAAHRFGNRRRLQHERLQYSRAIQFHSLVTGRPCRGGPIHPDSAKESNQLGMCSSPFGVWP